MDISYGLMAPNTKGTGGTTRPTGMANWYTPMEMSTKDIGLMTRHMERELTRMLMAHTTMGTGWMISNTGGAWNHGLMVPNMRGSTGMARKTAEAS